MKNLYCPILILWLFLATVSAASTPALGKGKNNHRSAVTSVANAKIDLGTVQTLHPEQLWHIGLDDDAEYGPIGHIVDAVTDNQDVTYLLDESLIKIKIFNATGTHLRDIGRCGEGPGEFNMPLRLAMFPDGNIGVLHHMPAQIILLDKEGNPQGLFSPPDKNSMRQRFFRARSSNNYSVISRSESTISGKMMTTTNRLEIYNIDGNFLTSAIEKTRESYSSGMSVSDGTELNSLASCWDFSPSNLLYVAPYFDEYIILVFDHTGKQRRTIKTEYEHVRKNNKQLRELEQGKKQLQRIEHRSIKINPNQRDIAGIFCRPNQEFWVLSSQGVKRCAENQLGIFHVYNEDGNFLRNQSLQVNYNPKRDRFIIDQGLLYILKEAQMMPATTSMHQFGNSMLAVSSHGPDEQEIADEPAKPFSVICYRLPLQ